MYYFDLKGKCFAFTWRKSHLAVKNMYVYDAGQRRCKVMLSVRRLPRHWIPAKVGEHQISALPRCSHMQQCGHTWRKCSGWTHRDGAWLSKQACTHAHTHTHTHKVGEERFSEGNAMQGSNDHAHTGYCHHSIFHIVKPTCLQLDELQCECD